ncbi:MAG: universal stress protein, partial [Desulfobacterales bacterium]|nr:universal stress protein [Desulfobacterales bacterium]
GLEKEMERCTAEWLLFEKGKFEENLYEVPHDALVVLGAFGHGLIRNFVFGSKMEKIHSTITNNLLIVGPKYAAPR